MFPRLLTKRMSRMGNRKRMRTTERSTRAKGETTPHIENEGADYSMNADPPGPSIGDEDAERELAKDAEE
ncbi:hypothetical protein F2Q69_00053547 [Brassica cretica]|uniref:Uncharacterized protein n=1 Tax=Brassica cretica TaxID=69181 RepID=A0A8S9MWL7_BRACR|nr:hypothetical protein F2Q69_00053547 [Brassica cretica]